MDSNVVNHAMPSILISVYEYHEDGSLKAYATATLHEREVWRREIPWANRIEMIDAATDAFARDFANALSPKE